MFGRFFGKTPDFVTLTPAALAEMLRDEHKNFVLIDVREASEWAGGHIPGAVHAPLSRLAAAAALAAEKPAIFYCQGGVRSRRAIDEARKLGIKVEGHLGGGFAGWRAAGLSVER